MTSPTPILELVRLSEVEPEPINWLWPGRIPKGKITLIAGHPGLGKSQVTVSIAAIVSSGGIWPVDEMPADVGNVLILSAEDGIADTIKPRLLAAGADTNRIEALEAVRAGDQRFPFSLKRDLELLRDTEASQCAHVCHACCLPSRPQGNKFTKSRMYFKIKSSQVTTKK